eukprot:3471632-Alexandrium_andersonii.AAC.1
MAVWSSEVVTSWRPSGEKAALMTASSWPSRVRTHSPEAVLHSLDVRPAEAVASREPSDEKQTALTRSPCPSNVSRQSPVAALHSFAE